MERVWRINGNGNVDKVKSLIGGFDGFLGKILAMRWVWVSLELSWFGVC
jgi:hypothetical protein